MNIRRILVAFAGVLMIGTTTIANAAVITATLPQFIDTTIDSTPESFSLGTFVYSVPVGDNVISGKISGRWGTDTGLFPLGNPSTNPNSSVYLDGILVAFTNALSSNSWSYTFTGAELSIFADGQAILTGTDGNDCCVFAVGQSTLELTTAPGTAVPEPTSVVLVGLGLAGLGAIRRKQKTA